jgi:hypothetical protein
MSLTSTAQPTGTPADSSGALNTTNLLTLYGAHRTAFYQLWNYLWLVIAASVTTSYAVDAVKLGSAGDAYTFRLMVFAGFAAYALVNLRLLWEVRRQMVLAHEGLEKTAGASDSVVSSLRPGPALGLLLTHLLLDLMVVVFHVILIRAA